MAVTQKTVIGKVDGTPVKRMFWSIISDYDLRTGLCELIDNAIDLWTTEGRKRDLNIEINLDPDRQLITVQDDSGGVSSKELELLLAPGGSKNDPLAELIGIFGVGGKRASIALGEQVEIRTRFKNEQTQQIDISRDWLESADWEAPKYAVPDITPSTTIVEISRLRNKLTEAQVDEMRGHLSETYAWFLQNGCNIRLNGPTIPAVTFDRWAYPKGFCPRLANVGIDYDDGRISAEIASGLISDRDPEAENYGVYIYCNNRLIAKELRTRDVGYFVTGEAGVPHPDASMCRAIVRLQGPAKYMPWNSSKSGINTGHQTFLTIRPTLIQLVSYFSSLSRRLKHEWDNKVTPFKSGKIVEIEQKDISAGRHLGLPSLPRVNKPQIEHLKTENESIIRKSPWTVGLVEAMAAVELVKRQHLDTRNRISLILLDSNFEISLKEFIVHRPDLYPPKHYPDSRIAAIFQSRSTVISEVTTKVRIDPNLIAKANHYYNLRNKLIHERATVGITDGDVETYEETVQAVLKVLFKLKFKN
jgi:hypothetical protein